MPHYKVQLSDGRTVELEGDSEPTEEDVLGSLPAPPEEKIFTGLQGPRIRADLAQATPPDTEGAFAPFVPLGPNIQAKTLPGQLLAAPYNVGKGLLEGVESRGGLATLPLGVGGRVAEGLIGAGFGLPAIKQGLQSVYEGTALKDPQQAIEGALQALTGGLITTAGAKAIIQKSIKGSANASTIRSDTGSPTEQGVHDGGSEDIRRQNLEQPAPQEPQPVVQGEEAQGQVVQAPPAAVTEGETPAAPAASTAKNPEVAPSEAGPAIPPDSTTPTNDQLGSVTHEVTEALTGPQMGAAGAEEIPPTGAGGEKYGISQRLREERAQAGQVDPIEPGVGINPEAAVARGNQLLDQGFDVHKAMDEFEKTGAVSPDAVMAARQYGEKLAAGARNIEEQFGTDSDQFRAAQKALNEWDARSKPMATAGHKIFVAHQGETDIDTGTFSGLDRAHNEATGKPIPEAKIPRAKKIAKAVKEASDSEAATKNEMAGELKKLGVTPEKVRDAEKAAFDAANKTVRENDIRLAKAETDARVAKTVRDKQVADVQRRAAADALKASQDVVKASAERLAKAESAVKEKAKLDEQQKSANSAVAAADKTVRDAAKKLADAENAKRVAKSARDKATAKVQEKAARKALDAADAAHREAAAELARTQSKLQGDPMARVWTKVGEYLDKGVNDFDDIRNKVATDLGMSVDRVTRIMNQKDRIKYLADDVWTKQQQTRNLKNQAKAWVAGASVDSLQKAGMAIPKVLFGLKVGFHGTVALGTHAPTVLFDPRYWGTYMRDFVKMYRMVGSKAYYESQIQNLTRRPNYTTARRAGLVNDPTVFEDYTSPEMIKYITAGGMGTRGYSILKILRQDMFDQRWNKLPRSAQIPEMAEAIADATNHSTGVVQGSAHPSVGLALFAPRLEASRVMWLAGDPLRALNTARKWSESTPAQKEFAINELKNKAYVAGTLYGLLAANQGILNATGSKQKVNFTDPFASDFLKFKVGGMNFSYGNAMLSMMRLPVEMVKIINSDGGKTKSLVYADESTATVIFRYLRSQMSPFGGTATDLFLGSDYASRPLPRAGFGLLPQNRPVPKRLQAQGLQQYTWPEYLSQQLSPIPVQEALKEVWKNGLGMTDKQAEGMKKALAISIVMGATGGRLNDDWTLKKQSAPKGF